MRSHPPWTELSICQCLLQCYAQTVMRCFIVTSGAESGGICAKEISFLLKDIPETRYVGAGGPSPFCGRVLQSIIFTGNPGSVVVEGNEFPQQPIVIAQSIWKP